jgi:hypothetical protein
VRRTIRHAALLGIGIALMVGLGLSAGCGGDAEPSAGRLIVVLDDGAGRRVETPVACTDAPELCALVRDILDSPGDEVCTQIYGGPQTISITGELDGRGIDLLITRTDGCQIHRYERVIAALPATDG